MPSPRAPHRVSLTGQRLREVADLSWRELDLDRRIWSLPSARAKNHHAHDTHLSDLVMEIIGRTPRFDQPGGPGWVFSVNGRQPVYAHAKARIDQRLQEILGMVEPWILHDLRRTVAELGVAPHVLDRVLNHVSGTIKGVARIYNRAEYKTERQAALDTWGRYVEEVVDRRRGNGFRFGGRIAGPTPAGIVKSS